MHKYLVIYEKAVIINDFAPDPLWIFLYMKKVLSFF
jgi:hypothetical protein